MSKALYYIYFLLLVLCSRKSSKFGSNNMFGIGATTLRNFLYLTDLYHCLNTTTPDSWSYFKLIWKGWSNLL